MMTKDEFRERLNDLERGPWVAKARLAKEYLKPNTNLSKWLSEERLLNLNQISRVMLPDDKNRETKLGVVLRWHGDRAITSKEEIEVRDSFDSALAYLEVLELALETGYLPLEIVRPKAREEIVSLLWSPAARQFVQYYDYVIVEYLANRVGVGGFRKFTPPEPDPAASIRFATFVSQDVAWSKDPYLQEWLYFLDDYVIQRGEQAKFYEYLESGESAPSERFRNLVAGIHQFLNYLADLFGILKEDETARFGLFYSYWLAKFFGEELGEKGYVKNERIWPGNDSWAKIIIGSHAFIPSHLATEHQKLYKGTLEKMVGVIEDAWKATRALVAASARKSR